MKIAAKIKKYIWLINTIRRARRITLAEINEKWLQTEMSEGVEIPRATFNRHRDDIRDIFGIDIANENRNCYNYYIENERVLRENTIQNWILSTLTVSNIVSESVAVQDRILLENILDTDYLPSVIEAMKSCVRIRFKYQRYGEQDVKELCLEPYCIKLFAKRWYVLGHYHQDATSNHSENDFYGIFAFDRIKELTLTDIKFVIDPDFNAAEYFSEHFGVLVHDDTEMERVVIRAFGQEQYYLQDLPMHQSQRKIGQGANYTDFELRLRPTIDFSSFLLGRGQRIKVISPKWLADEIYDMHVESAMQYEDIDN